MRKTGRCPEGKARKTIGERLRGSPNADDDGASEEGAWENRNWAEPVPAGAAPERVWKRRKKGFTMSRIDFPRAGTSNGDGNDMFELYRPLVEGAANCSNVLCDGYAAMGAEWLSFINRRLHTDLSLATRLAKCGSPQDLLQEWATFMNTAAEDYRVEFARLAEMNSMTSQRAISAAQINA